MTPAVLTHGFTTHGAENTSVGRRTRWRTRSIVTGTVAALGLSLLAAVPATADPNDPSTASRSAAGLARQLAPGGGAQRRGADRAGGGRGRDRAGRDGERSSRPFPGRGHRSRRGRRRGRRLGGLVPGQGECLRQRELPRRKPQCVHRAADGVVRRGLPRSGQLARPGGGRHAADPRRRVRRQGGGRHRAVGRRGGAGRRRGRQGAGRRGQDRRRSGRHRRRGTQVRSGRRGRPLQAALRHPLRAGAAGGDRGARAGARGAGRGGGRRIRGGSGGGAAAGQRRARGREPVAGHRGGGPGTELAAE